MTFVTRYCVAKPSVLLARAPQTQRRRANLIPHANADDDRASSDASPQPQHSNTRASLDLNDPAQTVVWGGNLPSLRRVVLGTLSATTVALVANLGGCTSALLSAGGGKLGTSIRADVLYPINGFTRCLNLTNGFEFRYPASWLADQTVAARQAQRREQQFSLDPPPASRSSTRIRQVVEPVVAFGPPGTTGEENISVIVASIQPGFRLASLGTPDVFGATFMATTVAPEGSGLTATLLDATQREIQDILYYQIEYTVTGPRFQRHNVSVIASVNDQLFTLNVQCPIPRWAQDGGMLLQAVSSFRLLV